MPEVAQVNVELDGRRHRLRRPQGQTLVEPCDVLSAADLDDGLILACQARAAGVDVHVEF
ncbi:hypothetical protein [Mycobacterium sp. MUNTM1]